MSESMKCLDGVIDLSLGSAVQNLEAARLQKPFTIEDTVIHMLSAPETADKEPGGNALPPESKMLCKSIYHTGESITALILKIFPLKLYDSV